MSTKNKYGRPIDETCLSRTGKKFILILTEDQYNKLETMSEKLQVAKANLVRAALDEFLGRMLK